MGKTTDTIKNIGVPVIVAVTGLLLNLSIALALYSAKLPVWNIFDNKEVSETFTFQMLALTVSLVSLVVMYRYDKKRFRKFFRWGNFLGQKDGGWVPQGILVAVFFTLGTATLMSYSVIKQHGEINRSFFSLLPLVILFAVTNAWSEEIIARFVIVSGLDGKLPADTICWISAIVFGLAHLSGTPNGLLGVIAAGALGWLLAKSVMVTRGLGWALLIHFFQDLVILGAGAMILAGGHT